MQYTTKQNIALLITRLIVGSIFIYAGLAKYALWGSPPEGMPTAMIYLLMFLTIVEPLGGIAVILGWMTKWAAKGLAVIMVGAASISKFMFQLPFFTGEIGSGVDYVVLIFAGCMVLATFGAGKWAVQRN